VNDWPLVSVCVPAYNAEVTLKQTLESVLAQDYPNIEIIVSDNQSTDNTPYIIREFADKDKRVHYCLHEAGRPEWALNMPNYIGGFANWNYVLSQARYGYICLFHADDLYEPSIVRKQVMIMRAYPKVGAVFTMLRAIGDNGQPIRMGCRRLPEELRGQKCFSFDVLLNAILMYDNFLATPSLMIRRDVYKAIGGFNERQFFTSADLEMWLRIAQKYDIGIIDEPLLNRRISQMQFGTQYNKLRIDQADFFMVVDHYLAMPEVQQIVRTRALAFYEMERSADKVFCAMNLLRQGRVVEARIQLKEALHWQHFMIARYRLCRLARLIAGMGLLISIWLGLGTMAGTGLYRIYQNSLRQRQSPIQEK
jgi:hypothetical protein